MSAKPTVRQQEILELMAKGYCLTLVGGIDPWCYLLSSIERDRIIVRSDTPFHLRRKGLIEIEKENGSVTTYKLKETQV